MKRTLSRELGAHVGETVRFRGWLNNVRALGKVNFLIARDRLGFVQIVVQDKSEYQKIASLHPGSILDVTAKVASSTHTDIGVELVDPIITVEVPVKDVPPLEYYKADVPSDLEHILDHRSISLRNRKIQAVFRVQAEIVHAYRTYMHDIVGAVEYFGPGIVGASSEGGAEFFNVDYFGHTATLAQSNQLYKQMLVGVNERVFAILPFYRAENSNTVRHLTEGKQMEFEMGFFDHWHEVLDIEEGCIKFIVKHLAGACAHELATLGNPLVTVPEHIPFPRVTFKEALEIVYQRTGVDERQEPDLSPSMEKELCAFAREKHGTDCIFIIDWKRSKRPFYSYPSDTDPEITNTFDLLCAGSEITSGGQRRHTYESMIEGLREKGMDPAHFEDYLSIFKYGMPPHGGFGLGVERFTMTALGLQNIREASLFPSDPKRIAGNRIKAKIVFGAENIRNEIIRALKNGDKEFRHLQHEATPTSEASAKVRGTALEDGVKALVLRGKTSKKNVMCCISSHRKLDMKAVGDLVGEKCEFESPEVIMERFGLPVGGVPPFGNFLNLETYFDEEIRSRTTAAFNCGLQTESIVMKSTDLTDVIQPKFGKFSKAE